MPGKSGLRSSALAGFLKRVEPSGDKAQEHMTGAPKANLFTVVRAKSGTERWQGVCRELVGGMMIRKGKESKDNPNCANFLMIIII